MCAYIMLLPQDKGKACLAVKMGADDDSSRKPGSVPFKWEIKPGVPKIQSQQHTKQQPSPPRKLRPPPAGLVFVPPSPYATSRSFRSAPKTRSERRRFERPEIVAVGCFPASPLLRRKGGGMKEAPERDYGAVLETLARWSVSSRKSLVSSFRDSTSSSSPSNSSSYQSSPRPVSDAEWAGFGLF